MYFLIPKSRQEQVHLKTLINRYFKYSIEINDSTSYSVLEEYSDKGNDLHQIISDLNEGNYDKFDIL